MSVTGWRRAALGVQHSSIARLNFARQGVAEIDHQGKTESYDVRTLTRLWEVKVLLGPRLGLAWDRVAIVSGRRELADTLPLRHVDTSARYKMLRRAGLGADERAQLLCERERYPSSRRDVSVTLNREKDLAIVGVSRDEDYSQDGDFLIYALETMARCEFPESLQWKLAHNGQEGVDTVGFSEDDPHVVVVVWEPHWSNGKTRRYRVDPSTAQVATIG